MRPGGAEVAEEPEELLEAAEEPDETTPEELPEVVVWGVVVPLAELPVPAEEWLVEKPELPDEAPVEVPEEFLVVPELELPVELPSEVLEAERPL